MNYMFAGAIFTAEDTPWLLLAVGAGIILAFTPIVFIIWGLVGLKEKDLQKRNKRKKFLIIGVIWLLLVQYKFNLFGWILY